MDLGTSEAVVNKTKIPALKELSILIAQQY